MIKLSQKKGLILSMLYGFSKSSLQSYQYNILNDDERKIALLSKAVYYHVNMKMKKIRFTKKQMNKILTFQRTKLDAELDKLSSLHDGLTSPQILMILCLDWLINIDEDKTFKALFITHPLSVYIDEIYSKDKYKRYIKSHTSFMEDVLKQTL